MPNTGNASEKSVAPGAKVLAKMGGSNIAIEPIFLNAILVSREPPPPMRSINRLSPERFKAEDKPIAAPDTNNGQMGGKLSSFTLPPKPDTPANKRPPKAVPKAILTVFNAPIFITSGENTGVSKDGIYGNAREIIVLSVSVIRSP